MGQVVQNKLRGAREVTLAEVDGRSYPAKVRDSIARLFAPYLYSFFGTDDDKTTSSFIAALTGTHSFPAGANGVGKGEFV